MAGEKPEERILDFSRAWGSPEGMQGHGGAPPHWLWQHSGKTLRKKSNSFLACLALTRFQSIPCSPASQSIFLSYETEKLSKMQQ